jgi:hypothetical protein
MKEAKFLSKRQEHIKKGTSSDRIDKINKIKEFSSVFIPYSLAKITHLFRPVQRRGVYQGYALKNEC